MSFTDTTLDYAHRLGQIFGVKVSWGDQRDVGQAIYESQTIHAPYPLFPPDFGIFLHELGHILLNPREREEGWPDWKSEARASNFALKLYEQLDLPDVAKVAARLGDLLEPNLLAPIGRGETTYDEVRRAVYPELLVGRMAEANGHQPPSEDEVRGWLAGPPV